MFVNLIIIGIIIIISYYIYQNKCDMSLKYILYSLCAIMVINQLQKIMSKDLGEFFTPVDANEAIQNIASIYNKSNMTVDNLTITGKLDVKGTAKVDGMSTLSGIDNKNGIKTDGIDVIASNNSSITTDGHSLYFTNSDNTKQKWLMTNTEGIFRIYPRDRNVWVDTVYNASANTINTAWVNANATSNRAYI